jgi:hypothetical protein
MTVPQPGGGIPADDGDWDQARSDLDRYRDEGLILSWEHVPGRGLVVVAADMEERAYTSPGDAGEFLGGLASAECAIRTGKVRNIGGEEEARDGS